MTTAAATTREADKLVILAELIPHGQHVRPEHEGGAAGQASAEQRPEAAVNGVLKRFDKHQRAGATPQAFGWIKAIYANAIEYAGQKQALEGGIMMGTFLFVPGGVVGLAGCTALLVQASDLWFSWVMFIPGIAAMLLFTYWMTLFPLRHVWRTPKDLPLIFDRANRRVYRMAQQVQPGLAGLAKPWPVKALAYEWDLLDAEHQSELVGSANGGTRLHRLVFVVRKSAQDPTIIDHFEVGNGLGQTPEMVAAMYEHIRRYMEEGGPALPTPKEPLDSRPLQKPTWWQACGQAGPWGSRYGFWWKEHWPLAVMHHFLIGVTLGWFWLVWWRTGALLWWQALGSMLSAWLSLSMVWGQGTGIWLMAHTSYLLDWPAEVHQAIGPAQRKGEGW
jgi:hypothetical protein